MGFPRIPDKAWRAADHALKANVAVRLCDCQQHGLKAMPCPECGWDPRMETSEAYPLNEAVKQEEESMAKKTKKKRGKGC